MSKRKEFSKLNLLDRFLFNEAMEDPENMKTIGSAGYLEASVPPSPNAVLI